MMRQPRIKAVKALSDRMLEVRWVDARTTRVALDELIDRYEGLAPLREPRLFGQAEVDDWGWAVRWGDDIDIAARTLYRLAMEQAGEYMRPEAFREWRGKLGFSQEQAAQALGLSRRMIRYYESGEKPIPKTVRLACRGYSAEAAA